MVDLKRAKAVILGNLLSSYFKKVGGSRLAGLLKLLKGEMDVKLSKLELKDDILVRNQLSSDCSYIYIYKL
jgi:hypothetical protein